MKFNNERGDGATIVIAIVAVAGLLFAAYYAYAQNQRHTSKTAVVATPAASPSFTSAEAQDRVQTFYTEYNSHPDIATRPKLFSPDAVAGLKAADVSSNGDAVLCAQNQFDTVKTSVASSNGTTTVIDVVESFNAKPGVVIGAPQTVKVTVRLRDLMATNVTCPN